MLDLCFALYVRALRLFLFGNYICVLYLNMCFVLFCIFALAFLLLCMYCITDMTASVTGDMPVDVPPSINNKQ